MSEKRPKDNVEPQAGASRSPTPTPYGETVPFGWYDGTRPDPAHQPRRRNRRHGATHMSMEDPLANPPASTPEAPEPETGPSAPLSVADAWADVLVAVERVEPQDALSRAVGAAARASLRQATEQQPVTEQVVMAFQFMQTLGQALMVLEHRKQEGVAEVMRVLFAGRPPPGPNGALR